MKNSTLLCFEDYRSQGQRLAKALGMSHQEVSIHRFPDEESLVRLPPTLKALWSTDSITHTSNVVCLDALLAQALLTSVYA